MYLNANDPTPIAILPFGNLKHTVTTTIIST
jgi:hypothetical protein